MWCETSSPRPGWEAGGGWHAGATQAQLARVGRRTTAMQAACSRGLRRCGAGHGEERTSNIRSMLVTLEVSKLSGWLNADAYCRRRKAGICDRHKMLGEVQARRREGVGRRGETCMGGGPD